MKTLDMADDQKNNGVISKNNSGFPEYLNFDRLRAEGIDYLGRLSGKIWTDHNVHDPGITILEVLCYALLDLGYRMNLPAADIFARNPEDKSTDNNFFTPAQILACNPLTITDFRKLLIDIEGVKNAWLEIATDQVDFCRRPGPNDIEEGTENCLQYLNGLYHVYIDLEVDVDKKYKDDQQGKTDYLKSIENKVRFSLMAHRNLCEDFVDIHFLCKNEIGVCVDIELENNTDAEKVYLAVVEKLRLFFSPSPQFYTLSQLLERKKTMDEIFAGRPHNISESHGFVDTIELEQLELRKEIHLSDVYNILFEVKGVKSVRNLILQTCKKTGTNSPQKNKGWKYHIPENHALEFSVACSGFQFTRNGIPVVVDFKKYDGLFAINFSHNGKVLHKSPSPYLDAEIPPGIFRKDLDDYYSIQNEFPLVYGIGEGGLGDSASAKRKAQAYQLKGYLLFFDQLLANFLSQLSHIRSLFAMSPGKMGDESHTYFINQLSTVPDLQNLLRFNRNENDTHTLGSIGSLLVFPVDRKELLKLKDDNKLNEIQLENLKSFTFLTLTDKDVAVNQIKNDLYFEQYACEYITRSDDCVFYYILTSSDDIALISKRYFKSISEATENATSVKYIGTFDENYRSFITDNNAFSFAVELNLLSFSKYLQLIVEDKDLFIRRRQGFLDHLLSRFAEQFTDYALLSYNFYYKQSAIIRNKEKYLSGYDVLSSNRGKAYDYLQNNWNNDNVSGLERKFKAITGIDNWKRHSLCNFVVDQYNNQYALGLKISGTTYFTATDTFDSKEDAMTEAQSLFRALPERSNYETYFVSHDNAFQLRINYAKDRWAVYPSTFPSKAEALAVVDNLTKLFVTKPPSESVFESSHIYTPVLSNALGERIRKSVDVYPSDEEAKDRVLQAVKKINDRNKWSYGENDPNIGKLYYDVKRTGELSFINSEAFKIDIGSTIVGRPNVFTYDILDRENTFKLRSVKEFEKDKLALANALELLTMMADRSYYDIFTDKVSDKVSFRIVHDGETQALCSVESDSQDEIEELIKRILGIVKSQQFTISLDKEPVSWRFGYELGYERNNTHFFQSLEEYDSLEKATTAASIFSEALPTLQLKETKEDLRLIPSKNKEKVSSVSWVPKSGASPTRKVNDAINKLLKEKNEINNLMESEGSEAFSASVDLNDSSKQGLFVYRLVDKDRVLAGFTFGFGDKDKATGAIKPLVKHSISSVSYLQLCMGGDNVVEVKHPVTQTTWYRYQLKCLNHFYKSGSLAGKPLVLLESTERFSTRKEAEEEFRKNYLTLIRHASTLSGYDREINLAEIPIETHDRPAKTESIAFIPQVTLNDLGNSEDVVKQTITDLMSTYPIRLVAYKSKDFYKLFPCEVAEEDTEIDDCNKKNYKLVYYFILQLGPQESGKWQSLNYYQAPDEALKDFRFFVTLLHYPGNYFVDCDPCLKEGAPYYIRIREVLAESAQRFATEEQAWGADGVEKFICISQTENAFHSYQRKEDCCFSFYVACGSGLVYHPCKYDTPKKRDDALLGLYKSFREEVIKKKAWQTELSGDLILKDGDGKSFATVNITNQDNNCVSDWLADLRDLVGEEENYKEIDGRIFLMKDSIRVASSTLEGATISSWRKILKLFFCYYPISVTKTGAGRTAKKKYCIEIKLPGFNSCQEDLTEEKPCGCGNEVGERTSLCHIAWRGNCCYETCAEAERSLNIIYQLLQVYELYLPVFDCECHSHGIELRIRKLPIDYNNQLEEIIPGWGRSIIAAFNPQCYSTKEHACESVERAWKLVNSEGLHLVEHILLRPRCNPEDCRCPQYNKQCEEQTECKFAWKVAEEDPCLTSEDICFVPGSDRYSFIATIVLPAWPDRFRKQKDRLLIENILYREAPAHILLRILWLAPHDFCCFETKLKKWNRWLAGKKNCVDNFTICDFLEFLFERNYECLTDCNACESCEDDREKLESCFSTEEVSQPVNEFLNQINRLHCWVEQNCDSQFLPCDEVRDPIDIIPRSLSSDSTARASEPLEKEKASKKDKKAGEGEVKKTVELMSSDESSSLKSKRKSQVVNSRMTKYRTMVGQVVEKSKNNSIAAKTQSFITDPHPSIERLERLVAEVLENKSDKTKGNKKLTKAQINALLKNSIAYFLDKICFNGKNIKELSELEKVIEKLHRSKVNVKTIFKYWDLEEVKKLEADLDESLLKKLFHHS